MQLEADILVLLNNTIITYAGACAADAVMPAPAAGMGLSVALAGCGLPSTRAAAPAGVPMQPSAVAWEPYDSCYRSCLAAPTPVLSITMRVHGNIHLCGTTGVARTYFALGGPMWLHT